MKILVLHSGGLDSTVCLLSALRDQHEVISFGIDYGQRHRIELEYASAQCRARGIERRVVRVEWDKPARGFPTGRSVEEIRGGVSVAFLPGRNLVFLSLACAEAAGIGAQEIWIGVNSIDFSGYPDCRPEFVHAFGLAVEAGLPGGPRIVAPLMGLSKPDIAARARDLGLASGDTWSCYRPRLMPEGIGPCGECDACVLHAHAWREASGRMPE